MVPCKTGADGASLTEGWDLGRVRGFYGDTARSIKVRGLFTPITVVTAVILESFY